MIVHRLTRAPFAALDGEGARLWGGRWNSPGRPMVYAAGSPNLALLEVLVHLDLPLDLLPDDYRMLAIDLPDDAPLEDLREATPPASPAIGDAFLARCEALALLVPSVIVPQERNALINPRHPAMARVAVLSDDPFILDPRLLRA